MRIVDTRNTDVIKSVLCHPEIYGCIACDNSMPADEFDPPMTEGVQYVAGLVNGVIIGLMIYHDVGGEVKCHIQVLPEFRKEHAKKFAQMALNFGKAKNVSIYAEIPVCYPNVLSFSKAFGFHEAGIIKDSYPKDGENHDVTIVRLKNVVR